MAHVYLLQREQWIGKPLGEVFAFFSDPRNLETLTPPWLKFQIVSAPDTLACGAEIRCHLAWRFFPVKWKTVIAEWNPPRSFVDVQEQGPYRLWEHTHRFEPAGGTRMLDSVRYELPLGFLGRLAHEFRVRRDLERIFDYRNTTIARLFAGPPDSPSGPDPR